LSRKYIVLMPLLVVALIAAFAVPASAAIVQPTTNPFNVPAADAAGDPAFFTITANGYSPSEAVFVQQCDGVPPTTTGYSAADHCDIQTSGAAVNADANGVATFPASDASTRLNVFKGLGPSGTFNCLSPNQASPNNGHPDWRNCQVRVSGGTIGDTSQQTFFTIVLPDAVTPTAPVPQNQALTVGTGSTTTITLSATPDPANPTNGYQITQLPTGGAVTVNSSAAVLNTSYVPNNGTSLDIVYTAPSTASTQTLSFQVQDAAFAFGAGGTGTVTIQVGAAPVDQQLTEQVTGGQLVLSCSAPGSPGYPALTCPTIPLPAVQLNGANQTVSAPANTLYVSDNRGSLTADWSLSSYMVKTLSVPGCTTTDFCNANAGADLSLSSNHIPAADLSLAPSSCNPYTGTVSPPAAVGSGGNYGGAPIGVCSATHPNAIGTFTANGSFSLTIPASTAAGLYKGTVEYLAA
jgi:hypothetical protein